jgi:hypothetical protein
MWSKLDRISKRVEKDFPKEHRDEVFSLLELYNKEEKESVRLAILDAAKGNIEKVRKYSATAVGYHDSRDLLGELFLLIPKKCNSKNHYICNGHVYQKWLKETKETVWVCSRCGWKHDYNTLVTKKLFNSSQSEATCDCEFCGTCKHLYLPSGECPCKH